MPRRVVVFFIVLVVAALAVFGYESILHWSYTRHVILPPNMLAGSSTDGSGTGGGSGLSASTTPGAFGETDPASMSPAFVTIDTSSWLSYSDPVHGYSIRYPAGLSENTDTQGNLVLAFRSDQYFHWPLLDDSKVTVTASSSCPSLVGGAPTSTSTIVAADGYSFVRTEGGDVAAGNIYRELAYDTVAGGVCYHLDLLDHGANGAGLYVGDQSLIAQYDAQHQTDLYAVLSTFNAMVNSFRLK